MPQVKREREDEDEEGNYESDLGDDIEGAHGDDSGDQDVEHGGNTFGFGESTRIDFFAKGAIKQVKVHDFMTYNGTCTIRPGPRLNLILGPNGTGKSSFVCALCIGLNGSPKTLGRADDIREFVRRGAHSFWTEITLSAGGEGRDYVIRRNVTTRRERTGDGGTQLRYDSKWAINGRDVPAREVDKLVKQLNVQFDNLCQFLPQDKVVEFAKMDQYELLAATQKALGDSSLYDQHQQLIKLRKDEKQATADRNTSANRLAKLQAEQDRQRSDYERFQQREKLLQEARSLRCQAKWLEVSAKAKAAEAAKQRLAEKQAALKALEEQEEEDKGPIRAKEELVSRLKLQMAAVMRKAREADSRMRELGKQLAGQDGDVVQLTEELASLEKQSKKRAADIAEARQKLAAAEAQLAGAPERPPQSFHDRIAEIRANSIKGRTEAGELELHLNELASQSRSIQAEIGRVHGQLDLLDSRKHQLLQALGNTPATRNIGHLHEWIEQHRSDNTFRGPVFGPVALEMTVKTVPGLPYATALQYVENTCWTWLASYIVTCKEDEARLTHEARRLNVGFGVKAVAATEERGEDYQPEYPSGQASRHARYGIMHTVDDLIQAPPPVMRLLAKQCKTTSVFIGTNHAAAAMTDLAQETSVNTVLVGASRFSVIRSRYANARSIEERELSPSKLLGNCGGAEEEAERAELKDREQRLMQEVEHLQASRAEIQKKLQQHEEQQYAWKREYDHISQQAQAITQRRATLAANVETARRQLGNKEAQPDPELRRPELRRNIEAKMAAHASLCRRLLEETESAWAAACEVCFAECKLREASAQHVTLMESSKQRESQLSAARNSVLAADKTFQAYKSELARSRENAQENFPLEEADKDEVRRHNEAGTQPSVLAEQADEKEKKAEEVVCHNQNVVTEFRRRQSEISQLTEALQHHDNELQQLRQKITDIKDTWLPEIRKMVETINESFSTNFKEIGYAGQVRLHEEEDFDKFAIEILVQFRAGEGMQLLTGSRQSGGERSVSTILYLIALQGVTDTPFRVVDEINQGMDPINERKVFQQLVAASTEEHTPQCFLLTPKLLENLVYGPNIQVLSICAGSSIGEEVITGFKMGEGHNNGTSMFGTRATAALAKRQRFQESP